ncbi:MAG: septal ring lytic transglycosylase RlpA family protein [Methyloceanibacter sp.]|jgi:peptidoglycan lytic transglycosylase|nr:septal ring lytic transglycosylase RlpA family protein [Methyloceanibacter sp.]
MRGVAGALPPFNIRPLTLVAAVSVAAVCVGGALYIANAIIANAIVSPGEQAEPRLAKVAPQPSQSIAPKAGSVHRKAARPPIEDPSASEDSVAPGVVPVALEPPVAPDAAALEPEEPEAASGAPTETGRASWYALPGPTASGEAMDEAALTAAHPSLPLGTKVKVDNLANGRSVVVRINDRGPFTKNRIIDVSKGAAAELGMIKAGVARVRVSPVEGVVASAIEASAKALPLQR